jgi:hypothetical protein
MKVLSSVSHMLDKLNKHGENYGFPYVLLSLQNGSLIN